MNDWLHILPDIEGIRCLHVIFLLLTKRTRKNMFNAKDIKQKKKGKNSSLDWLIRVSMEPHTVSLCLLFQYMVFVRKHKMGVDQWLNMLESLFLVGCKIGIYNTPLPEAHFRLVPTWRSIKPSRHTVLLRTCVYVCVYLVEWFFPLLLLFQMTCVWHIVPRKSNKKKCKW